MGPSSNRSARLGEAHHESEPTQRRHAEYALAQLQIGSASRDPAEIERRLEKLGGLIDDVRACLRWAFSQGADVGLAVELAIASAPLGAIFSLHEEFCAYLERATVALSSMPSADPRTALRLALAHGALAVHSRGDYSAFVLAYELAEAHGSDRERELALEGIWSRSLFGLADYEVAVTLAQQHVAATSKQPSAARVNSQRMLGLALHFAGRHTAARERLERVMSYETSQREGAAFKIDPRISAGISLSRIHWLQGRFAMAEALAAETLERAAASDHAVTWCYSLAIAGCPLAFWGGQIAEAERLTLELENASSKHSLRYWRLWARAYRCALIGSANNASPELNRMQLETLATIRCELAAPELLLSAERDEHRWCAPELLRCAAEGTAQVSVERAEQLLRRALNVSRRQEAAFWELRAATSLARVLLTRDRVAEARDVLSARVDMLSDDPGGGPPGLRGT